MKHLEISKENFGQENMPANNGKLSALRTKTIHYDPSELKRIQTMLLEQHDYRYKKKLPIDTIKIIRNLRLNPKRRRHLYTAQKRLKNRPTKLDISNLITLNKGLTRKYKNLIIGTCNAHSIRNKDLQISDLLNDYSIDILAVIETWLMDKQSDKL